MSVIDAPGADLHEPYVVGLNVFLRTEDPGVLLWQPSAPEILAPAGGTPAAVLDLYRGELDSAGATSSGGVLACLIDVGRVGESGAAAASQLPSDAPHALAAPMVDNLRIQLRLGDEIVADSTPVSGRRPIVALSVNTAPDVATMLRTAADGGTQGPLTAMATASVRIANPPQARLRVDFARALGTLPTEPVLDLADLDTALDACLAGGSAMLMQLGKPDPAAELLARNALAAALFEPAAGKPISFYPGVRAPDYAPTGEVRARSVGSGVTEIDLAGAGLTWFGAGPLSLAGMQVRLDELDSPPIATIQVRQNLAPSSFPALIEVSAEGQSRTIELAGPTDATFALRFPAGGPDWRYRWRVGVGAPGSRTFGDWVESSARMLLISGR